MKIIDIFKLFHRKTNNKRLNIFKKIKKNRIFWNQSLKSYKISVTSTKSIYKNLFLKYIDFVKTLIIGGSSKIGRNFNSKKFLLTFNSNRIKMGKI